MSGTPVAIPFLLAALLGGCVVTFDEPVEPPPAVPEPPAIPVPESVPAPPVPRQAP